MHQKDIQFLINTGHTIGCHSATHQILSKIISEKELRKELLNSKNNLEKIFDIKIKHFAFPFGTFERLWGSRSRFFTPPGRNRNRDDSGRLHEWEGGRNFFLGVVLQGLCILRSQGEGLTSIRI